MKMLDVTEDLRSARLLKCCQGVAGAGLIEAAAAKRLVAHARAVRQLMEAGNYDLARTAIAHIREVCDEGAVQPVTDAVEGHLLALERVLP